MIKISVSWTWTWGMSLRCAFWLTFYFLVFSTIQGKQRPDKKPKGYTNAIITAAHMGKFWPLVWLQVLHTRGGKSNVPVKSYCLNPVLPLTSFKRNKVQSSAEHSNSKMPESVHWLAQCKLVKWALKRLLRVWAPNRHWTHDVWYRTTCLNHTIVFSLSTIFTLFSTPP